MQSAAECTVVPPATPPKLGVKLWCGSDHHGATHRPQQTGPCATAPVQAEMQTLPQHQAEQFNRSLFYFCDCRSKIMRNIHTPGLLPSFLKLTMEFPAFPSTTSGFPSPKSWAILSTVKLRSGIAGNGHTQFDPDLPPSWGSKSI